MNDMEHFRRIFRQLKASNRIHEILDVNGEIQPSSQNIRRIRAEHSIESPAEQWQMAQTQTLIDLALRYDRELN
jgi:hypothetical protein